MELSWVDLLWVVLLGVLAVLPPIFEVHKDLILLAIGITQLFEQRIFGHIQPAESQNLQPIDQDTASNFIARTYWQYSHQ